MKVAQQVGPHLPRLVWPTPLLNAPTAHQKDPWGVPRMEAFLQETISLLEASQLYRSFSILEEVMMNFDGNRRIPFLAMGLHEHQHGRAHGVVSPLTGSHVM